MDKLLFKDTEWTISQIENAWEVIKSIAVNKYALSLYDVNIEVITHDHMLQLMATHGLGNMYSHWSFGKAYEKYKKAYERGEASIPYELFNSGDPCFCYIVEGNTAAMQTLVLAHAAVGHNNFDKENFLFKEWINPKTIGPRLTYAREFVKQCEQEYGGAAVEAVLDACHALKYNGVDRFKRVRMPSPRKVAEKKERRRVFIEEMELSKNPRKDIKVSKKKEPSWPLPEENILYFIEKNSPVIPQWKKELIRIVRTQAQFLYPRIETKLMNEGWASFWHYTLTQDLFNEGHIDIGTYIEVLHSHTGVAHEIDMSMQHNPYALGYEIWKDLRRACESPTEEDYKYLPLAAGKPWLDTLKWIRDNFKDTTFIMEFLGPNVIKKFNMFAAKTDFDNEVIEITAVASEDYIYGVRKSLAAQYGYDAYIPTVEVISYNKTTDRQLTLAYKRVKGVDLVEKNLSQLVKYIHKLWGQPVEFQVYDEHNLTKPAYNILRRF